ncbi:MAG: polyketide cyclase [Cyanobacteria bacterium P01_D01_bin.105]
MEPSNIEFSNQKLFNIQFSNTVETTASAEAIWALWSNVEQWPVWDFELQRAWLEGPFEKGAVGYFEPKQGAKSRFVISQLTSHDQAEQQSYTFTVQLPLCQLHMRHYFGDSAELRTFTHEVSFQGSSAFLFNWLVGKRLRTVVPQLMQAIKTLAEWEASTQPVASTAGPRKIFSDRTKN